MFFVQLIAILDYLYHPKDSQLSRIPFRYAKLSYVSTICMIGGLAFVFITQFFYGFISTGANMQPSGYFGISDLGEIFKSSKWNSLSTYDLLNEFLFGYFATLLIIFLKNCKDKFK